MPPQHDWLNKLTLPQLHRLATRIGSACSGTKSTRIQDIQNAIKDACQVAAFQSPDKPLSIVSIDMGIRNLAYCHLKSAVPTADLASIAIEIAGWKRLSVEITHPNDGNNEPELHQSLASPKSKSKSESYEPATYATRAHSFVKYILDSYQPTHVLIERQRFRSGGQAAVQEWTIRVGVFEAMLYAVFATMNAEKHQTCQLIPILPQQVNRYWLESDKGESPKCTKGKATGNAVKLQKIGCVEALLHANSNANDLQLSDDAKLTASHFGSRPKRRATSTSTAKLKLDDLSDSLLQGLAWIRWQNNRLRLDALQDIAFDLR